MSEWCAEQGGRRNEVTSILRLQSDDRLGLAARLDEW